jgi:uncharacterized membrane protein
MFHTSVNSKTAMTFILLIFALASLFVTDHILGNQQALAANAGGSFGGGGSVGSTHA